LARDAVATGAFRAADRDAFERDGYLQIPGFLSAEQCAGLAEVARTCLPPEFRSANPRDWRGRIRDCCTDLPLYQRKGLLRFKAADGFRAHPAVEDAVHANPKVAGLFESFLGVELETLRVRGLNSNFPFPRTVSLNELFGTRPDPEMRGGAWDRIRAPAPLQFPITPHLETHAVELGALVYLTDVGEHGGGLGVWPGSHRLFARAFSSSIDFLPNALYKRIFRLLQGRKPRVLQGKAGDAILFHNRLLHANTFNRSSDIRHALLIDALGVGWRETAAIPRMGEAELAALGTGAAFASSEEVRSVIEALPRDRLGALMARRPRLAATIHGVSRDPSAAGRSHLSAKIRTRRTGDLWIVVSQTDEHARSYKLDAYGLERHGAYRAALNGTELGSSLCGILVEQVEPTPGEHRLELTGRFARPHHVRVVRTRQPVARSEVLHVGVIAAGSAGYSASFSVA
jgi:hypothetical protein